LRAHFALGERASAFKQAVGKRGLAVIDMRDDAEVAYEPGIHEFIFSGRGARDFSAALETQVCHRIARRPTRAPLLATRATRGLARNRETLYSSFGSAAAGLPPANPIPRSILSVSGWQ
jgi:hypothetical protein